jgi:ArsR family transcriptional regulator
MSKSKSKDALRFAEMFKALSNPHRLSIFLRLAVSCCRDGVCCTEEEASAYVGELGRDLGIVPSTVSHHIKELSRAGLILMKRSGQNVRCWVEPETLEKLSGFFALAETE